MLILALGIFAFLIAGPFDRDQESVGGDERFGRAYADELLKVSSLAEADPKQAWEYLKSEYLIDGQQIGNPHELAHLVGGKLYEQFGLTGLSVCDEAFAFGCYHGVTQELLLQEGKKAVRAVQSQCLEIFPQEQFAKAASCIHGMGHGLLSRAQGKLKVALQNCDLLDQAYREFCYDGVFMENSFLVVNPDLTDPWQFCGKLAQIYQLGCARYQTAILLSAHQNDFAKVAAACESAPSQFLNERCSQALGLFIAQQSQGRLQNILAACLSIGSSHGQEQCVSGAATETVFQAYQDWQQTAQSLCESIKNSQGEECFIQVALTAQNYERN